MLIFEKRNLAFSNASRVCDYIGKSIRENTIIYSFDDVTNHIAILTESDHIIDGTLKFNEGSISLQKIKVSPVDSYFSNDSIDSRINESSASLISNLNNCRFSQAENSFDSIVGFLTDKISMKRHRNLLETKKKSILSRNMLKTDLWASITANKQNLVDFVKENKSTILKNKDIVNSILMSRAVRAAINVPLLTLDELSKRKRFSIPANHKDSIYEMICRKELIQKELLEAKNSFSTMWTNSTAMRNLALGFNKEDKHDLVSEAIAEVPMFTLATKQQIADIFERVLSVYSNAARVSEAKLSDHISKVYEAKKPFKTEILKILNENYGISVQNLKYRPSFDSLSKINSSTLEILGKTCKAWKKNPALVNLLGEASKALKSNAGFSALYFSDLLDTVFTESGLLSEMPMGQGEMKELNLDKIKAELMKIRDAIALSRGQQNAGSQEPMNSGEGEMDPELSDEDPAVGNPEEETPGGPPSTDAEAEVDDRMAQIDEPQEDPMAGGEEDMGPAPGSEEEMSSGGLMAGEVSTEDEILDLAREIESLLSDEGQEEAMEDGVEPHNEFEEEEEF